MADLRFLSGLSGGLRGFQSGRARRRLIEEKEAEKRLEQARSELRILEREADRKVETQRFEDEFKLKQSAEKRAQAAFDAPEPTQALFDPSEDTFRQAPPGVQIRGSVPQPRAEAAQRETPEEKVLLKLALEGSDAAANALFQLQGTKLRASRKKSGGFLGFGGKEELVIEPSTLPGQAAPQEQEKAGFFDAIFGGKQETPDVQGKQLREQAISLLRQNGKVVNEDSINNIIAQLKAQ